MKNAEETFVGWRGDYPVPQGGMVIFTCKHPRGFSDGSKQHTTTCSSRAPDAWCSTFVEERAPTCPHPREVYPECRLSEMGKEYTGSINQTEMGKDCFRWDSPELIELFNVDSLDGFNPNLFYKEHFINLDPFSHDNYCRNPTSKERPWCFVDDGHIHPEYCSCSTRSTS
ncbi:unnamed protein product [Darwinula stevensoni]|uniref:Kringle domain-containing protein n=1 Tax=Darwinula stevensoni TaxID=69355 RepID=A0A7R9AAZ0_9CRUS|nr:unnamed protein product [Darwinula stevensoni]CAG0898565.1 unnamed protein product [Darwinula stevensoni]